MMDHGLRLFFEEFIKLTHSEKIKWKQMQENLAADFIEEFV